MLIFVSQKGEKRTLLNYLGNVALSKVQQISTIGTLKAFNLLEDESLQKEKHGKQFYIQNHFS